MFTALAHIFINTKTSAVKSENGIVQWLAISFHRRCRLKPLQADLGLEPGVPDPGLSLSLAILE